MTLLFRPYWLIAVLFLFGASFAYLSWLQGAGVPPVRIPTIEVGNEGSVLHYAGMVLNRALTAPYAGLMLFALGVLLVYTLVQGLGLLMDARRQRRWRSARPFRSVPRWLSRIIAPVLGRPIERFAESGNWTTAQWRTYLFQAPRSLLAPLSLATQTFPLLGFLGTVAGIASALKYLPTGENADASVTNLTASLYTAFDTTFIGLVASVILMLCSYAMEQTWTRLQQAVEEQQPGSGTPPPGAASDSRDGADAN